MKKVTFLIISLILTATTSFSKMTIENIKKNQNEVSLHDYELLNTNKHADNKKETAKKYPFYSVIISLIALAGIATSTPFIIKVLIDNSIIDGYLKNIFSDFIEEEKVFLKKKFKEFCIFTRKERIIESVIGDEFLMQFILEVFWLREINQKETPPQPIVNMAQELKGILRHLAKGYHVRTNGLELEFLIRFIRSLGKLFTENIPTRETDHGISSKVEILKECTTNLKNVVKISPINYNVTALQERFFELAQSLLPSEQENELLIFLNSNGFKDILIKDHKIIVNRLHPQI